MIRRLFTSAGALAVIRVLVTAIGAWLSAEGYVADGAVDAAWEAAAQIVGPAMVLIGLGGDLISSLRNKVQRNGHVIARLPEDDRQIVREIADQAIAARKQQDGPLRRFLRELLFEPR